MYALNRMIMVTTTISTTKGTGTMVTTKVTLPMAIHETDVFSLYLHTHIGKRQLSWSFSTIMGNFFTT